MRVLYFDPHAVESPGFGGTSDTVWRMAEAMATLGHEPVIAGYYTRTNFPSNNIEVHRFPLPSVMRRNIVTVTSGAVVSWLRVRQIPNIDLIHLRDYLHAGVFARLSNKLPIVLTTPGNVYERIERGIPYYDPLTLQVYKWAARSVSRRADGVIAHSSEQRDWWLFTGTSPLRIVQYPLGVDEARFHPVSDARQQLGLETNVKILLFVSRLHWYLKGIDLLLNMVACVRESIPNIKLYIAGDGPDRERVEAWVADHGLQDNVQILNWITPEQLLLWYNAADICVSTSRSEPFSRVMLEAMACGTPFIGSPHGGMLDNIVNGENGYVVNPEDTKAFSEIVKRLLTDRTHASKIGSNALDFVTTHFSWKSVMQKVIDNVYTPLLQGRTPLTNYSE